MRLCFQRYKNRGILVFKGCCNNIPQTGCQHGQVLVRTLFQVSEAFFLVVPSHGSSVGKGDRDLVSLLMQKVKN